MIKNKLIIALLIVLVAIIVFVIVDDLNTSSEFSGEKFVEVYVQLSIVSDMYATDPPKLEEERKNILEKYRVTQKEIDHFVKEYNRNPEKWAEVWEKIVRRLEEEKEKEKAKSP